MSSLFEHIEQLADCLPFEIDDSPSVNAAFREWFDHPTDERRRIVDVWTYCFVYRYFTWKYIQHAAGSVADFEHLVSRTFRKVMQHRTTLDASARYASWVSVICKRTFLNFARGRNDVVFLDDQLRDSLVSEAPPRIRDRVSVRRELAGAIMRLPEYLQEAAELRFLRNMDYPEIEKLTGRSTPTLRAYCHKALQKLSEDSELRLFFEKWDDDIGG